MKFIIRMIKLDFPAKMADKELERLINMAYALSWICLPFCGLAWFIVEQGSATHWAGIIPLAVMVLVVATATLIGMAYCGYRATVRWASTRGATLVPVPLPVPASEPSIAA